MRPDPKLRKRLLAAATVLAIAVTTSVASAAAQNGNGNHGDNAQGAAQNAGNGQSSSSNGNSAAAPVVATTAATPAVSTTGGGAPSNADFSGNGANVHGPYDSTSDGSPSMNGNDDSNSNKPCAGCVGNADNKNPPGQMPNGSDPNAGYECDRNQGVGQGNPAHSGCRPTPTVTPPVTPPVNPPVTPPAPPATPPAPPVTPPAPAAPNPPVPPATPKPPQVPDADTPETPVAGVQDQPTATATAAAEELPFTGLDIGMVGWLGMALIGAGVLMARRFRGRPQH